MNELQIWIYTFYSIHTHTSLSTALRLLFKFFFSFSKNRRRKKSTAKRKVHNFLCSPLGLFICFFVFDFREFYSFFGVCIRGLPLAYNSKLHVHLKWNTWIEPNAYRRNWMMSHCVMVAFFSFSLSLYYFTDMALSERIQIHLHTLVSQTIAQPILFCLNIFQVKFRKFISNNRTDSLFVSLRSLLLQLFFSFFFLLICFHRSCTSSKLFQKCLCCTLPSPRNPTSRDERGKKIAVHFQSTNDAHENPIGEKSMNLFFEKKKYILSVDPVIFIECGPNSFRILYILMLKTII